MSEPAPGRQAALEYLEHTNQPGSAFIWYQPWRLWLPARQWWLQRRLDLLAEQQAERP
jgi:hypothetical protein